MELSIENLTESKADKKNGRSNAVEKSQLSADTPPPGSSKKKRKKRNKTRIDDNLPTQTCSASTSQPGFPQHPSINSVIPLDDLAIAPAVVHDAVYQEKSVRTLGKQAKKGRNSKKKTVAEHCISQATQGASLQENSALQSKKLQKWITPKPGGFGVPAGLQPMNFIRQSSPANQESPKQEKFSCYWTNKEVESGLASGLLISGIIRINPRNYQKSYITPADDEDAKDVLIDGIIDRNRALEGDEVAVKLYDQSNWQVEESTDGNPVIQKTGMVVSILEKHHNRRTVGYLKLVQKTSRFTKKKTANGKLKIATTGSQEQEQHNKGSCSSQKMQSPQQIPASNPTSGLLETPIDFSAAKAEKFKFPDKVLFSPRDARMPRMWVKTSSLPSGTPSNINPSNCQHYLFLACIHEWNELPIAYGNLLAYIGEADEVDTETTALLLEHGLDVTPYPDNLCTLPPLPFEIPQKELDERLDLRRNCIFTVDPVTAKDLDDALSVHEIGEGLLEVGVHIADPTFFLEEGSPLDLCVRRRATSIYLVQNVFHMLPKDLCSLCSLLPGEDKLAFSLIMEVDANNWKVLSHKFSRSIINSCAQLSYEHAQAFIDDPDHNWLSEDFPVVHNGFTIGDICHAVNLMRPFSAALREKRFAFSDCEIDSDECGIQGGGALKINQPKLCFKLDHSTSMPKEIFIYENKESHRLEQYPLDVAAASSSIYTVSSCLVPLYTAHL